MLVVLERCFPPEVGQALRTCPGIEESFDGQSLVALVRGATGAVKPSNIALVSSSLLFGTLWLVSLSESRLSFEHFRRGAGNKDKVLESGIVGRLRESSAKAKT